METLKKVGLVLVLLDFAALLAWAAFTGSTGELLTSHFSNPWSIQITVDLLVGLCFGIAWMWQDAKKRSINPLPWAIGTVLTGSLALLAYMVRRSFAPDPATREQLVTA